MITELWGMICTKLGILAFMYLLIFVAVMLDLWSGVRKAKQRKEYTSSYGLRRTLDKLAKYYNVILALTVADMLQMGFLWHYCATSEASIPLIPVITAAGALFICFVEIKSIFESADKKMKGEYQEAARHLSEVLKHRDKTEIISALLGLIGQEKKKDDDTGTTQQ